MQNPVVKILGDCEEVPLRHALVGLYIHPPPCVCGEGVMGGGEGTGPGLRLHPSRGPQTSVPVIASFRGNFTV